MAKGASLLVDVGQGLSIMLGLPTIALWDNKNRPKKPRRGTFGFNFQASRLEYYDGSAWFYAVMDKL